MKKVQHMGEFKMLFESYYAFLNRTVFRHRNRGIPLNWKNRFSGGGLTPEIEFQGGKTMNIDFFFNFSSFLIKLNTSSTMCQY